MKHITLSAFLLIAFFSVSALSQSPATPSPSASPSPAVPAKEKVSIKTKTTAAQYEDLLKKVKGGDLTIDFALLRLSYSQTKDHSPYGGGDERSAMSTAFREKKFDDVIKTTDKYLAKNFVDLHSHYYATLAYSELGKAKESEFHRNVLKKLIDAIWENDGLTPQTGLIALGISEQYFVMSVEGFERKTKTLENHDGSTFDVHQAENAKTGEKRKFYFNIDKVFGKF